jgi:hypothetical protein
MTLDIRGSLKNTKINSGKYIVIEELISNSIDSFLIRRHQYPSGSNLKIAISVDLFTVDLLGGQLDLSITCTDNGCGLGDDQTNAFLTKDTSYKDDLPIAGIGMCKGSGRIQFFHHFGQVSVRSVYRSDEGVFVRTLPPLNGRKKIEFDDFAVSEGEAAEVGTAITLANLKSGPRKDIYASEPLEETFAAANIRRHMLVAFLQRLVSLRADLGDFDIAFQTRYPDNRVEKASLSAPDLPAVTEVRTILVEEQDSQTGAPLGRHQEFRLSHYKLDATIYDLPRNAISLCAKSSPVKDITGRYLRTRTEQNNPVAGYHHIVLIEGVLLDRRVNEQRDGFDGIPEELPSHDLLMDETVSYEAIYEKIDPIIEELVVPTGWNRDGVIKDVLDKFGVSSRMLVDTETRVRHGDSARSVAERVVKKYQDRIIADTAKIFDLKEEIVRADPYSKDFREKINELSWKYASSLKTFDMANLSQLVVRRAAIVEILALACDKKLDVQTTALDRRQDETIIHSIFFPMRRDSLEVSDHDIWLLSEEYQYFDYIASDKSLSQIKWSDDEKLFEEDIDEALNEILNRRAEEHAAKRPDIAIFSKEGSAIIVEFKAPDVSMDDHTNDLEEYAQLLAAKSRGRLKRFYGYLIGGKINRLRMPGWTKFPTGRGYFRSTPLRDPENDRVLGELYAETLFFEDLVDRARKRIGVYKDRLQVDLSRS